MERRSTYEAPTLVIGQGRCQSTATRTLLGQRRLESLRALPRHLTLGMTLSLKNGLPGLTLKVQSWRTKSEQQRRIELLSAPHRGSQAGGREAGQGWAGSLGAGSLAVGARADVEQLGDAGRHRRAPSGNRRMWPISVQCRALEAGVAGHHAHCVRAARMPIVEYLGETFAKVPLLIADHAGRARLCALAQIASADTQSLLSPRVRAYLDTELGIAEPERGEVGSPLVRPRLASDRNAAERTR